MVNPFVWISGFSDPNDLDFKGQKGKWEEAFNKKLSTFSALSEFLYGGVTILSMKQDEFTDTSIHVETEIVFGAEVAIQNKYLLMELSSNLPTFRQTVLTSRKRWTGSTSGER